MNTKIEITLDKLANLICKKLGYNKAVYLGKGSNGIIYSISDNLILKITNNKQEALIAQDLCNYNFKHITNFYSTFTISSKKYKITDYKLRLPYFEDIYCIISEKCFVNDDIPKIITDIQNVIVDSGIVFKNEDFFKVLLANNTLKKVKKYLAQDNNPFIFLKNNEEYFKYFSELFQIALELYDNNIKHIDSHGWNFGIKNNQLCVFDILNKKKYKNIQSQIDLNEKNKI